MDSYPSGYPQRQPQNWNGGQNSYLGNYQNVQAGQMNTGNVGYQNYGNFQNNQPQTMVQQSMIPGRLVTSLDDVIPGEVPMNGNPTYFPTADGEMVHVLRWTREGKIEPTTYIRQKVAASTSQLEAAQNDEAFQMIINRLDEMQKEIKRISRPRKRNQVNHAQPVKEENEDA